MTSKRDTRAWLDLYDMTLDRAYEFAKDPLRGALARGITQQELEQQKNTAVLPGKMDMDAYRALRDSWKRVRTTLQIFGMEMGDDLMIEPTCVLEQSSKAFAIWLCKPWVEVGRGIEKPLRFEGRDALTVIGFLNFYSQQCETVDPTARIKAALEAQGITKDNFHEQVGAAGIRNPWENDAPQTPKGQS